MANGSQPNNNINIQVWICDLLWHGPWCGCHIQNSSPGGQVVLRGARNRAARPHATSSLPACWGFRLSTEKASWKLWSASCQAACAKVTRLNPDLFRHCHSVQKLTVYMSVLKHWSFNRRWGGKNGNKKKRFLLVKLPSPSHIEWHYYITYNFYSTWKDF